MCEAFCVCVLFEADGADNECYACYFVERYVEGRVFLVVGDGCEAVLVLRGHEAFDENALLAGGDYVTFVPLQEFAVIKYCTGYHIAGVKVRVHGKSGDFNHEVDV